MELAGTPEIDQLDPMLRRERLEAVTSDFLGRVLSKPVLLVVNDVHFMDEATLSLVSRLAREVTDRPWLIIAARRTGTVEDLDLGPDARAPRTRAAGHRGHRAVAGGVARRCSAAARTGCVSSSSGPVAIRCS